MINNITMGADPELFLVSNKTNDLVPATLLFDFYGQVGSDGMLMEIRPTPNVDEHVVTYNMYSLIKRARAHLDKSVVNKDLHGKDITMAATASMYNMYAGFHLHYGLPQVLLGHELWKKRIAAQITSIMDYYIGISCTIIEGDYEELRRNQTLINYGKPGDFRLSEKTYEYRVPSAALLKHPMTSSGLLGVGVTVIEDILNKIYIKTNGFKDIEKFKSNTWILDMYPNVPNEKELRAIICSKTTAGAKKYAYNIARDIKNMLGYNKRTFSIINFINYMFNGISYSGDIYKNWRLFYSNGDKD